MSRPSDIPELWHVFSELVLIIPMGMHNHYGAHLVRSQDVTHTCVRSVTIISGILPALLE